MAEAGRPSLRASMMCRSCFYKLRHKPDKVEHLLGKNRCPRCKGRKLIHVKLNDGGIYETTYVRERPSSTTWPVRCNPSKQKCGGDQCLYAHGEEELEKWMEDYIQKTKAMETEARPERFQLPKPPPPVAEDNPFTDDWPDWDDITKKKAATEEASSSLERAASSVSQEDSCGASTASQQSIAACYHDQQTSYWGPIENRWHQQGSGILDTGTSQAMDTLDDVKHGPLHVDKTDQDFNDSTMTTTMKLKSQKEEFGQTSQNELVVGSKVADVGPVKQMNSPASPRIREPTNVQPDKIGGALSPVNQNVKKKSKAKQKKKMLSSSIEAVTVSTDAEISSKMGVSPAFKKNLEPHDAVKSKPDACVSCATNPMEGKIKLKESGEQMPSQTHSKECGKQSSARSNISKTGSWEGIKFSISEESIRKSDVQSNLGSELSPFTSKKEEKVKTKENKDRQTLSNKPIDWKSSGTYNSEVYEGVKSSSQATCDVKSNSNAGPSLVVQKRPTEENNFQTIPTKMFSSQQKQTSHKYNEWYLPGVDNYDFHQALTQDNYREKYHRLLCLEEQEHLDQLAERCNKSYDIVFCKVFDYKKSESILAYIDVPSSRSEDSGSSDALAYAKQASSSSTIFVNNRTIKATHIYDALIPNDIQHNFNAICFSFTLDRLSRLGDINFVNRLARIQGHVIFEADVKYFIRMHKAIDDLPQAVLAKIVPDRCRFSIKYEEVEHMQWPPFKLDEKGQKKKQMELNKEQVTALKKIQSFDPALPFIVLGSFGTGKTRLLARSAYNAVCNKGRNRALLVAHHQSSADTLVNHFIELGNYRIKVLRICKSGEWRDKAKGVIYIPIDKIRDNGTYLDDYDIVVTTLGISRNLFFKVSEKRREGYFSHIFIDEGAQTREPEAIIPLCLAGEHTKIVIAGDHCQVGPSVLVLGQKSRECGLQESMLERLHQLYSAHQPHSDNYTASLIRNYRCVPEILLLASALYYELSLLCEVPISKDSWYPLQFVCSNIDDVDSCRDQNEAEAEIVISEVIKYLSSHGDHTVCIVSPSPAQCHILRTFKYHAGLRKVEVLKTYDIQGREFDAIFISTCEEVHSNRAINHTRSLSNHYVFNTVITRAKSLIVAVGNPYLLIKMEKDMVTRFPGRAKPCWTPFLKKCFSFEQFKFSESATLKVTEDSHKKLIDFFISLVYNEKLDFTINIKIDDSILEAYTRSYEDEHVSKRGRKMLARTRDKLLADDDIDFDKIKYKNKYECVLHSSSFNEAVAAPLQSNDPVVHIIGKRNRIGALNGDTVTVGTFSDFLPDKVYGRVLGVEERVTNLNIVCEVCQENSDIFYPIDNKNPGFKNFPTFSKLVRGQGKFARTTREPVIVYSPSTSNSGTPRIIDMIEHSRALNMAFVVRFVQWNPKYSNAFGIVIKAYPKGYNHLYAELLLSIVHSVPLAPAFNEEDDCAPVQTTVQSSQVDVCFPPAFTIDPKDARNLDDALTLHQIEVSESSVKYQFGVHIVNAARHVKPDSTEDKDALKKGSAYYYKSCGRTKMIPMLPSHLLNELSLTPGNVRDAWSVTCTVRADQNGNILSTDTVQIKPTQVCSILQLSYEDAQDILNGSFPSEKAMRFDSSNSVSLKDTFDLLYYLSLHFARNRLHNNEKMYWYSGDSPEDLSCWQAHKLVQELMIWANSEVSKRLYLSNPIGVLLRYQRPPEQIRLDDLQTSMKGILDMSFDLCRHSTGNSELQHFQVSQSVLRLMKKKISEGDVIGVAGVIMSDCLFPQLSVGRSKRNIASSKSKYCITEMGIPKKEYSHYSLNLETYTHFTSPLRRYADIIVQRMLTSDCTNGDGSNRDVEDQNNGNWDVEDQNDGNGDVVDQELCKRINECSMKVSSFEKDFAKVDFSLSTIFNSQVYLACIESNTKSKIIFTLLDIELSRQLHDISVKVASLGPFMSKNSKSKHLAAHQYSWRVKVTSLSKFALGDFRDAAVSKFHDEQEQCTTLIEAFKSSGENLQKVYYKINFKNLCVPIDPKDWKKAMEFAKNPTVDELSSLDFLDNNQHESILVQSSGVEVGTMEYPFMNYIVSLSLKETEVFNIWMNMRKKKCLPEPVVQMIELSPIFRVCVQHNTHPAYCFSDFFLKQASLHHYRSITEYVNLWQSVLLAEAAVASVHEAQAFIIRDVHLTWPKFTLCPATTDGSFSYMVKHDITWNIPKSFMEIMFEYFKVKIGDLVCARYGTNDGQYKKAFHFVIKEVEKRNKDTKTIDDLTVTMKLSKQENTFSHDIKEFLKDDALKAKCEIQIINMCQSHRRVYEALMKLLKFEDVTPVTKLIHCVTVRPDTLEYKSVKDMSIKVTDRILKEDKWALNLWIDKTNSKLNKWQRKSVELALQGKFQLIRGPPGTGKSVTGAHIAYIFAMHNCHFFRGEKENQPFVLYCGPSNKSVDVVFEKFYKFNMSHTDQPIKLIRIYGRVVENNDFPTLPENYLGNTSNYTCPSWGRPFTLHHLIRDSGSADERIREFIELETRMKEIRESSMPSAQFCKSFRDAQQGAEKAVLKRGYDIVLCTCNEVSGSRLRKVGVVSHCIIDEAGMANEPESLMPINHCEHVVLIGDHAQLQPVIVHRPASDKGLSKSLFERYADNHEDYMYSLRVQYRMHEAICEFPSKEFYEEELITAKSVLSRQEKETCLEGFWPAGPQCPIVFCDVIGEEIQEETGTIDGKRVGIESKHNLMEAKKVVEIVKSLCSHKYGVTSDKVAILTPYSAQKIIIQNELKKDKIDVKVATISESQGDEYGFVILSVVRSKPKEYIQHPEYICADQYWLEENLGFVTNRHQINVGITRSKYGLIIIGNRLLLSYNSTWKRLIGHYESKNCVKDESEFPPKNDD